MSTIKERKKIRFMEAKQIYDRLSDVPGVNLISNLSKHSLLTWNPSEKIEVIIEPRWGKDGITVVIHFSKMNDAEKLMLFLKSLT